MTVHVDEPSSGTVVKGVHDTQVFYVTISAPAKPPANASPEALLKFIFVPYWWIESTFDEAKANMQIKKVKVGDTTVGIMENKRALQPNERLYFFKAKQVRAALAGVSVSAVPSSSSSKKRKTPVNAD